MEDLKTSKGYYIFQIHFEKRSLVSPSIPFFRFLSLFFPHCNYFPIFVRIQPLRIFISFVFRLLRFKLDREKYRKMKNARVFTLIKHQILLDFCNSIFKK